MPCIDLGSRWYLFRSNNMLGYAVSTSNFEMYTSSRSQNSTFSESSSYSRISFCCCSRYVVNYLRELFSKDCSAGFQFGGRYQAKLCFPSYEKGKNLLFQFSYQVTMKLECGIWKVDIDKKSYGQVLHQYFPQLLINAVCWLFALFKLSITKAVFLQILLLLEQT